MAEQKIDWTAVDVEAAKLADELIGTCLMGSESELYENASDEVKEQLDQYMFICDTCGWCCDASECNETDAGDLLCDDCWEEEYGDEDDD